jgi:4-carboxymuconolactone decarboxylase
MPAPSIPEVELSARYRHAVLVSAALVSRRGPALAADLRRALDAALTPAEVSELILQSLLFDGYPCALEGFKALRTVLGEGSGRKAPVETYSDKNIAKWRKRGHDLCARIYGKNLSALLRNVESLSPTLKEWMLIEGYGRVLSRPGLDPAMRELGIVAILAVKSLPRQLESHMRGALHVGVTLPELHSAIGLCLPYGKVMQIKAALNSCHRLVFKAQQTSQYGRNWQDL